MTNYERLCQLLCGGPTAYTPSGVTQWRQANRYGKTPAVGAFIYFYSSNLGRVSHVGIVTSATQSNRVYRITTIEGNSGAGENATAWRDAQVLQLLPHLLVRTSPSKVPSLKFA